MKRSCCGNLWVLAGGGRRLLLPPLIAAAALGAEDARLRPGQAEWEPVALLGSRESLQLNEKAGGRYGELLFGKPDAPLRVPDSVAVDPKGNVWITDRGNKTLHMYDAAGGNPKVITGAGQMRFECPAGIDADSMGHIYLADSCLGRVFILDSGGKFIRFLNDGGHSEILKRPTALAVSRDRRMVFVVDAARQKLVVLNQEGEALGGWAIDSQPGRKDVVREAGGRVYVLGRQRDEVTVFSTSGARLGALKWDRAKDIGALAYDPVRRRFYVGDDRFGTVLVFDEAGSLRGAFGQNGSGAAELSAPGSLYVDREGRVYVVDSRKAKVVVFEERGAAGRRPQEPAEAPKLKRRDQ